MMYLDNGNITIINLHGELSQYCEVKRRVLSSVGGVSQGGVEATGRGLIHPEIHALGS